MATAILNPLFGKVTGRIGGLVFRNCNGRRIVSRAPAKRRDDPTESQLAQRLRFRLAAAYARAALANPPARFYYTAIGATRKMSAHSTAVRDFLSPPRILDLALTLYQGHPQDEIIVHAVDDTEVAGVTVVIKDMVGKIAAKTDIDAQRQDLSDVRHLVKGLLSSTNTELFSEQDGTRLVVLPTSGESPFKALVVFVLKEVPFKDSVRLQYWIHSQPPNAYMVAGNILIFNWGDAIDRLKNEELKTHSFYVEYIADPSKAGDLNSIVSIRPGEDGGVEFKKPIEAFSIPRNVISPKSIAPAAKQ